MTAVTTESQPLDIRAYAGVLWRRKWIFLATIVLLPAAVYLVSRSQSKVYEASVVMQVQPAPVDTSLLSGQVNVPTLQSADVAARLIQTVGVAQAAARHLPPPRPSATALLRAMRVSVDQDTLLITLTAKASNPSRAAAMANAFGSSVNATRARQAVRVINQAIAHVQSQISVLPVRGDLARTQLSNQLQRLKVLRAAQGTNAQVIDPATVPSAPVSPRPRRDALLALLAGLPLGLVLVALAESWDRRIREPEDVEHLLGLSLLTSVPGSAFGRSLDDSVTIEAFRNLRANLEFFNVDREIRSLVVTSGRKGEGKTMVALNLAHAYSLGGADVILVEADLRRPAISSRLGMAPANGLAATLVGKSSLDEVLYERKRALEENGRMRIIPAGDLPPNPAELLRSQRMHRLLEELSTMCDLVIIDTSPLLAVSDALPLLDRVSGTLLVARVGLVQRDELLHVKKLLAAAQSVSVGIVATGTKERQSSYGYTYTARPPGAEHVSNNGYSASPRQMLLGRRRRS
jgi:succinoglycan biosynthesis transport protein ExoP